MAEGTRKLALPDEIIASKIYFIRDKKVMLDEDLAELYGVTTGNLNKAVKRNISRFPDDFMFQFTKAEFEILIYQIGTSSWGGRRKLPYAFTEQGVAMLSGVLNSERAIMVNIQIMRVFTKIREILMDNMSIRLEIEEIKRKLTNQDKNIELVFSYLDELIEKHDTRIPVKVKGFKSSGNDKH
ncbi:MAG TPA: ORF6N domain-containing protein [Bacteroidales bacterium]|nr:ORF6N domain-containing protein [Bacteroidales bacterium]